MSESAKAPVPGSASALKQRREAYEIVGSARDVVGDARSRLDLGMAKEAKADLDALAKSIDANPEARRMLAEQQPETLRALNTLRSQATAEAPHQVRLTSSTDWRVHDGGATETKVLFGESGRGHHYMLLTSERGGEPDGAWSKPFPTAEAALVAGTNAQWRATTTGFELPQKSGPVEAPADGRRQAEADVWGGRERAGQSARAEAPKQAQRAGQNMSAGG